MAYDRAESHFCGEFPKDLPYQAGATHIGMFLAWIIMNGLEREVLKECCPDALEAVRQRRMTGTHFLLFYSDEKFTQDDLSDEGNRFARWHYGDYGPYLKDYEKTLVGKLPSFYHVADTWENFNKLSPVIDRRYATWKARLGRKPWWRFW